MHLEGGAKVGQQESIIAYGGVIFVETTQGNVYAVDGVTGAIKWSYKPGYGSQQRRGAAIGNGLLYTTFAGRRIEALDINTGAKVWSVTLDSSLGGVGPVAMTYWDGMVYVGSANNSFNSGIALNATNGAVVWSFQGVAPPSDPAAYATWGGGPQAGAAPWMHPAVDPITSTVFWTFGNSRGNSSQNGSNRPGDNLYANSLVAMDAKTGAKKWHFQSVHHDIWDMDNVMAPLLIDTTVQGQPRNVIVYGSKAGMFYLLDRNTGQPIFPIDEVAVPQDPRQSNSPTQPMPRNGSYVSTCPTSSGPTQAPPNFTTGCIYTPHWDLPVYSYPGNGGGGNWSAMSYSPHTGYFYDGYANIGGAHDLTETSNGFRAIGERTQGGIIAFNPATDTVVWKKDMPYGQANGQGILSTPTDILFTGSVDGYMLALDALSGRELWRFQTGAGVNGSPMTYMGNDGAQYVAVFSGGSTLPYSDAPLGDTLWAFKIGGTVPQAATPTPPTLRRPVTSTAVAGTAVNNTVYLNRTYSNGVVSSTETDGGTNGNGMAPQFMTVPVGTTVTFINPVGNTHNHCATQFFEGLFNFGPLAPGQSATYTFTQPGEYFYNDCTYPKATGKIVVQ